MHLVQLYARHRWQAQQEDPMSPTTTDCVIGSVVRRDGVSSLDAPLFIRDVCDKLSASLVREQVIDGYVHGLEQSVLQFGIVIRHPNVSEPGMVHRDGGKGIVLLYLQECQGPHRFGFGFFCGRTAQSCLEPAWYIQTPGTVLYMNPQLWHCSPSNESSQPVYAMYCWDKTRTPTLL